MSQIIISPNDILTIVNKTVGDNGQISIGKEHAGKEVIAYIVKKK